MNEEADALAARYFPKKWEAALALEGGKGRLHRQKLRAAALAEHEIRPMRIAGSSCGSCVHFLAVPAEAQAKVKARRYCDRARRPGDA